ncbi:hypothetical protein [Bacteroides sp.]|jgi:hypothetical protein|uniref:hypothetical protein n=1 Tax=Bacteroides sp. TaxID=29523 RepID=UPI003AAD88BD
MPIRQVTPNSEVNSYIERKLEIWRQLLIRNFSYIGEQVLNAARSTDSYKDQTGNLRSSLGYVVAVDGRVADISSFAVVKNGQEGSKTGADYARKLARKYPKGIVLIVCAGMNYAAYVSAKGYDVEDSAELLADRLVPQMLRQLGLK